MIHRMDCEIVYSAKYCPSHDKLKPTVYPLSWKLPSTDCKILPVTSGDVLFDVHNIISFFSHTRMMLFHTRMTLLHTRTMLFHKNPGGKPPEGPGRRPLLGTPGIWLMSGRGPYGSKRGRGSPVPGVGLIPPGMNGKLGNRSLWPPEIKKKWCTGHVKMLTKEPISHITILQSWS